MRDNQLLEMIDRYLTGEMMPQEREEFELLRQKDNSVNAKVEEHKNFTSLIKQYNERVNLETRLNAIHQEVDVHTLKDDLMAHPSWIVQMWRNHHSKISVAASVAILAVLLTLFITGDLSNKDPRFQQLKADVERVKFQQDRLGKQQQNIINTVKTGPSANAKFRGTGFAISSNGYIVTNFHVVNGGDSVYVQNDAGESFHTKVIYTDPANDLAFLQIIDTAFKNLGPIPYTFKKAKSDLGEEVYTIGYPGNDIKIAPGALTGATGFKGDTTEYELYIPVNPGNSGGPLLDNKGNIIGIINGKQTEAMGVGFAVKSNYLLKSISNIPADSLSKTLSLNTKNTMASLSRPQQIKKLRNYVFMVKVYNQ
ncbi:MULTISPECIES: S1C family serine protease [unclassified Mucilaginibacter]|uniref:S1C family serine protease n=1 Tax=unclassified Mucilaginibacter TaxID=2617802 RepID=UPI0009669276|nr:MULTISPECIES: S1C family serine protease [unclassified Mucilaginibacter]OJW18560.1 MAG: serine protease [Mucilaginibacter sp. 44-25]PLW89192.1 MAG: serine protease [Mucilaginibacter sp.]PMP64995.1 MAG: serine protease [Mucilaginibacter sp.]HEK19133.1 serine protease [Bacteroidota bacterium]